MEDALAAFPLHAALAEGDDEAIGRLFRRADLVNAPDPAGATPLIVACQVNPQAVARLLEAGADAGLRMHSGTGAAHIACAGGHAGVISQLGQASPEALCAANRIGDTPAHACCAAGGQPAALAALLGALKEADERKAASGPPPRAPVHGMLARALQAANKHGDSPLLLACRSGAFECVGLLLEARADALARHPRSGARPADLLRVACEAARSSAAAGVEEQIEGALRSLAAAERRAEAEAEAAAVELIAEDTVGKEQARSKRAARVQRGKPGRALPAGAGVGAGVEQAGAGLQRAADRASSTSSASDELSDKDSTPQAEDSTLHAIDSPERAREALTPIATDADTPGDSGDTPHPGWSVAGRRRARGSPHAASATMQPQQAEAQTALAPCAAHSGRAATPAELPLAASDEPPRTARTPNPASVCPAVVSAPRVVPSSRVDRARSPTRGAAGHQQGHQQAPRRAESPAAETNAAQQAQGRATASQPRLLGSPTRRGAACVACARADHTLLALAPRASELALEPAHLLATQAALRAMSVTQLELLLTLLGAQLLRVGAELGGRSEALGVTVTDVTDELSAELLSCGVGLSVLDASAHADGSALSERLGSSAGKPPEWPTPREQLVRLGESAEPV
ncbi:hypothetical protein T492DRAFT_950004 [Pavlovales sp. CCMP2436]|nr:hypothetical protein T492DRAFT_950004 [Pavlovales sp. CCMP2436]|mmetsp:Transcript_20176/g.47675  ORF Transcript_20176/g.47675 Transcript_20176/m.47675 type:complete len:633 (-) Transcript_20176:36-1934(-)